MTTRALPETARLHELVAVVESSQRTEDVEAFLGLFADDATWVSAGGVRLVGKEAIAAFTREVLPGAMTDLSVRYAIAHLAFVADDVAVTSVDQEYLTADGASFDPPRRGLPTYVWRRQDGDWRIVAGQNTGVPAADADVEAAVLRIVGNVERGFNTKDVDLLVADVADDAVMVSAVGTVLRGRTEVEDGTRTALRTPRLREGKAHYRVSDVAQLAPDVVVAHKSAWETPEQADAGETPAMNALYVLQRRDGRWWIVRRQNTLVVS